MATLTTTKKTAVRLQNMLLELLDQRARKEKSRRPRWHSSRSGKDWKLDTHILGELYDAVEHFNTVIEQPTEEEE